MFPVKCLVAQKVPIRPGVKKGLVGFPGPFPDGKGNCAVGISGFDGLDQVYHPLIGEIAVLPALQDEGAKAKIISGAAAGEDLFLGEPVARRVFVASADAAVEAVVPAVVGKFNKPTDINVMAVPALLLLPGQGEKLPGKLGRAPGNEGSPFFFCQGVLLFQTVEQGS